MRWDTILFILFACLHFGSSALAYDLAEVQKQIDQYGLDFTVRENWVTRLDSTERARLGGGFPPTNSPPHPIWTYDGPPSTREYLDWRDHNGGNFVSGIRDQESCGSCWAFAAVALLESKKSIHYWMRDEDIDYSEQCVLSCSGAGSCEGGSAFDAAEYLSVTGSPPETCFPYLADDSVPCEASCPEAEDYLGRLSDVAWVTYENVDVQAVKNALEGGPVIAWFQIYESFYGYDEGVYSAYGSDYAEVNHYVLIVGFDDALQCWIVKNSWGMGWGEDGFFRIAYDSGCMFSHYTITADYRPSDYAGPGFHVATDGDDYYNDGSEGQPFASCNRARYSASDGDSILVRPGYYYEDTIDASCRVIVTGVGETGDIIFEDAWMTAIGESGDEKVANLVFTGSAGSSLAGIFFQSSPHFEKCIFSYGESWDFQIVSVESSPLFYQCSFVGNSATLFDLQSSTILFDACMIAHNEERLIHCDAESGVEMSCSLMWGNDGGDYTGCFEGLESVNGNLWDDPQLCEVEAGEYFLFLGSPCLPQHNDCDTNIGALGLGCGGDILHVSVSGSDTEGNGSEQDPWQSIMWAVTQSANYDTVLVHPGTYSGPMNTGVGFLGKPLALVGAEGPGATVIDCQSAGRAVDIEVSDDYWHWKGERLIQGLTIKNGLAGSGGGAYVQGSVDFVDCHFFDNRAIRGGGGLYYSPWDSISIRSCLFEGNEAGGGGALNLMFPSYVSIEECVFHNNSAEHGGAIQATVFPSLPVSELLIRSSTFALNTAVQGSQMSFCTNPYEEHSFEVRIESSILSYGIGSQPIVEYCPPNIVLDVQCSDIFGHESGDFMGLLSEFEGLYGNISEEPLFCSMDDGDFTLNDISPCLPENNDCGLLMGALPQGCTYPVTTPEDPPVSGIALEAFPNPFNPELMVVFSLPTSSDIDCRIYDLAGREVRTLLEKSPWDAGTHEIKWDGRDDLGRSSASGIYFVRLNASTERLTRKVTLLK